MPTSDDLLAQMRHLHPLLIDLSLDRIERLLAQLGSPQDRLPPVIHIAGTNGKGSTTAFLKAMFEAAGKRVHVYTSPHLVRFHERISLAGPDGRSRPIGEEALAQLLARVLAVNDNQPITFFEITTAAAFLAFAEHPADAVLLEVGLGGRYDTTNVIARPELTIITPVSMDHADKLGDTLAKIAHEKAGILKPGVTGIIAAQPEEAFGAIAAAAAKTRAPLAVWGQDFDAFEQNGRLVFQREGELLDLPLPSLTGRHQIANAGVCVAAAMHLRHLGLSDDAIDEGLITARWPARMQRLVDGPLLDLLGAQAELWLDGGHNESAGHALAQTMADIEERAPKPLVLIIGMMGQKDAAGFLAPFKGLARDVITVPIPSGNAPAYDAGQDADRLAAVAREAGLDAVPADSVVAALGRAHGIAAANGPLRVLICGSLYLAGHVLALQDGVTPQMN